MKDTKIQRDKETKIIKSWLEDKSRRVRQFIEPQAARFARIKKSQQKSRTLKIIRKTIVYSTPLGLALIILLLAFSYSFSKDRFQLAKERLAQNPQDFEAHLILAEEYLKIHQTKEAEKELLLAEKSQSINQIKDETPSQIKNTVLGATTSTLAELWERKKESDPQELRNLISQWKKIIEIRPDYRDGYLRLAFYQYKLYENEQAQETLRKALALDPNFEPAKELEKILSN